MPTAKKTDAETKKNDEVEVKLHRLKNCGIRLDVKAAPPLIKTARKKAIKEVAKEVEVPGFRKGKAPEALIIKKHAAQLEEQWHKEIAREVFVAIQKVLEIPPLSLHSQINFDLKKHSLEEGAELSYNFETEPTIPKVDPKKFKLKKLHKHPVGKKEVDEAIRQIRFFHAQWKEIKDRPIKEDDYIIIDLEATETDPPQKVFEGTRFEVSKKGMADWMRQLVIGAKVGDVLEGTSKPDEDAKAEEKKKFEPKKVRVTIKKVEEADLPEINDEFAKKVGSESVEKMREAITNMLKKQAEEKEDKEKRDQVNEFFVSIDFELPTTLVNAEKKHRMEQYMKDPRFKADFEKAPKEEKEKLEKSIEKNAISSIRLFYITRHLVEDAKLEIKEDEVNSVIFAMKPQYGMDVSKITKDDRALALSRLFLIKAQDYVLENATKKETEKS